MRLTVVGDIHAQVAKFWRILGEAGIVDDSRSPAGGFLTDADWRLILLGDLTHAKGRAQYAELAGVAEYDEYDPSHLAAAQTAQEAFLREVMELQRTLPEGRMVILLGNHDYNAIDEKQGPLRTDDVTHLEWKAGYGEPLPQDLAEWIGGWPRELQVERIHFAHVGPLPEHNTFDTDFYLDNRRRWIYEERDWLEGTPYALGVYGHTPVRGGVNLTSQGKAVLLDTNGHRDEYSYLEITEDPGGYRLRMRGLFFDEVVDS